MLMFACPIKVACLLEEQEEALRQFGESIYACRDELGLGSDPDPYMLRCDNFGLRDGRVVAIDYGDQFPRSSRCGRACLTWTARRG